MYRRFFIALLAAGLFFTPAVSSFAQESESATVSDSDWYYGKLIKSVTFKGLENVDSKDVDGIVSGFIGKRFSDEVFADMLDRIYALDYFEDVSPEAHEGDSRRSTVALVFTVKERPVVSRLIFVGNRQVRNTELKEAISIKEKDVYVASKALLDERAIRDLYLGKGFTNVKVTSSAKEGKRGVEVTFVVTEGRATVISEIAFRGNKVVSSRTLMRKVSLKEVGLVSKGAFQESSLEADKQAIVAYYQDNGYVDASVIDVTREVAINEKKNRDELTITFVIQEGSQYTYGGTTFEGNHIFTDEKLQSLMKIKPGAVFKQTRFQESLMAVADLYYENGYTSNRFEPVPQKDVETKSISYVFQISENVRSHIENIIIKGNTRTKEDVIRREIPLESGDIFSKAKITTGLRNLYNLQYFSAVVPDVISGSEENLVDVVFTVEEQSTTSIEFGVTFSGVSDADDLPFALFVKWQDSNIRGSGKSVSVNSSISTDQQSVGLAFGQSWIYGLPISASISTDFSHSNLTALRNKWLPDGTLDDDSYYMNYEQWKWSLGLTLGHRWTPDWAILSLSGGITGSLLNNVYDEDTLTPVDTTISEYANTWGWKNSVWTAFSVDDRDINYDPSSGWFVSQRLTWYGLTPVETEYFLRTDTKLEKYVTLLKFPVTETWDFKLVLAGYSGLSMEFPAPDHTIGESSRLYIDGMFNARGWTSIYNSVRGRAMWSNLVELRMPLVPHVLALDWFGDAAVITKDVYDLYHGLSVEDFYFSTGPGIRFTIPQFPLRLLFANTFRVVDNEIEWNNKWKFVLSFNITNK
ncbi:MAG: outer membrane protein assembly factor BamA [Treponema sp.]|nr:outer membrane protein assembly factor BamA [Treponema sp.]